MFCHNCGANLPEGTVFCGNCGARQNAQQRAASQQQAPVQQRQQPTPVQQRTAPQPPVYQPQPANRPPLPVSKKEFLSQHADPSTRQNVKLATATFILTLVLILASIVIPLATPFHKIPAVSLVPLFTNGTNLLSST